MSHLYVIFIIPFVVYSSFYCSLDHILTVLQVSPVKGGEFDATVCAYVYLVFEVPDRVNCLRKLMHVTVTVENTWGLLIQNESSLIFRINEGNRNR